MSRPWYYEGEWDRPFRLSAVAPSGRRPRPVVTSEQYGIDSTGPATVRFCYPVDYIPAGRRKAVRSWVQDETPVLLTSVGREDVEVAYKIRRFDNPNDEMEILKFEDRLWWSLPGCLPVRKFMSALAIGENAAVGLLDPGCVTHLRSARSIVDLQAKSVFFQGRDACVTKLNHGCRAVLVVAGKMFVREGPPVFVVWNGFWDYRIASIGIHQVVTEFASTRPTPAFKDESNDLIFGRLFGPDEVAAIRSFAIEHKVTIRGNDEIDVLIADETTRSTTDIQLRAVIGKLLRMLACPHETTRAGWLEKNAQIGRLQNVAGESVSMFERGVMLQNFAKWAIPDRTEWKKKFRIEMLFVADAIRRIQAETKRRNMPSPFPISLGDKDDLALDDLMRRSNF